MDNISVQFPLSIARGPTVIEPFRFRSQTIIDTYRPQNPYFRWPTKPLIRAVKPQAPTYEPS